jgi:retron-type reverse transcriptase
MVSRLYLLRQIHCLVQDALSIYENRAIDMNSYNNLIEKIADMQNLHEAYKRTAKAKRKTFGYLEFKEFKELNLELIRQELLDGTYKIGKYREFIIYEPKSRLVSALDFKDRLIQHAIVGIIEPLFEATFLPHTFACRVGFGTHAGANYIQAELRKEPKPLYYLKTDYSKFFPSVNHNILLEIIRKKITCKKTLYLIEEIIKPNEIGIPIGSLTSQLFANVYGGMIDQYIHHTLGHRRWARYMDDIVILDSDIDRLKNDFKKIYTYSKDHMEMNISKWHVRQVKYGINFLGYRIWDTHKLLRKNSVTRAKRKIARYKKIKDYLSLNKFMASWRGHASWANTKNLFTWLENKYDNHYQYA